MKPTISIPQHWGYPRFALEQRTEQGTILGLYQIRRWHLKQFFENPPQSIKKRIAALDTEAINYLLGRKA